MMKMWGSLLVLGGCTYVGWAKGQKMKAQVGITSSFILVLEFIYREIREKYCELPLLMEKIIKFDQTAVGRCFQNLREQFSQEKESSFAEKWATSLCNQSEFSVVLLELLAPLGHVLGQYDADSQGVAISEVLENMRRLKEKQTQEIEKMQTVYSAIGVTSGIFFVILFI